MKNPILSIAFILLACSALLAQAPPSALSFEVASIKPTPPQPMGMIRVVMDGDAGMIRYVNVSLKQIIRVAYRVKDFQIDGPDWLSSTRFDINAKFPAGATQDQVPEMLQSLLAERFKIAVHRDSKEHAIYALVVGKNGPQLKPAEVQTGDPASPDAANPGGPATIPRDKSEQQVQKPAGRGTPPRGMAMMMMDPAGMHLKAAATTLGGLSDMLSRFTERPVVDMTGIEGQYAFDLLFSPETVRGLPRGIEGPMPPPGGDRPREGEPQQADTQQAEPRASIFDAVQRYGLKLEPRKAPLEIVTIDHIEKTPTEN